MKEPICNLFLFINDDIIREIGVSWHREDGSDQRKLRRLQSLVDFDSKKCIRHRLPSEFSLVLEGQNIPSAMTYDSFKELQRQGFMMKILDQTIFQHYKFSPHNPLMVVTCVVNGKIKIDAHTDIDGKTL